jgi:DNA polymerase-1
MGRNDATNYPAQGSAFHCELWSFVELDRIMQEENWDTKLVSQIHDDIIFDVNPDELEHVAKTIKKVTTKDLPKAWPWIIVPLDIEMSLCPVDRPWAEKEKYEI